jgi:hypothetical protein
MKEQDLIALGFNRNDVTSEESGSPNDWYYYTYDFTEQLSLISIDSEEAEDKGWYVEFCDVQNEIRFTNIRELAKLITIIENAKICNKQE